MSEFEYIRQTTLRSIKRNFLQHCNLSSNEAIKVWANWVIVNRIREKQIDEFLPTENLELDNKTVSLLIEKGIPEDDAINFYSNFIQQCQRWKYRYEYYRADKLHLRKTEESDKEIDENSITLNVLEDRNSFQHSQHLQYFPPGFPVKVSIVYGLGPTINHPGLSFSVQKDMDTGKSPQPGSDPGSDRGPTSVPKYLGNDKSRSSSLTWVDPHALGNPEVLRGPGVIGHLGSKTVSEVFKDTSKEPTDMDTINVELIIDYRGLSNKIDSQSLRRLLNCYQTNKNSDPKLVKNTKNSLIKFRLWKLLNNYSLLDGLSYQWSLPPETFDLLTTSCNLRAELFASPLNHHVKHYYSLFEIDREFGSSGDFFESSYKDFSTGGFYEANPPFIESIFIQASQLILSYLESAKEDNVDLIFMWIMPDWLDSFAYKRLKASSFLKTELIIRKGQHKYWEYRKNRLIQANFNTHVLILSSNEDFFRRIWLNQTENGFIKTMSY